MILILVAIGFAISYRNDVKRLKRGVRDVIVESKTHYDWDTLHRDLNNLIGDK